MRLDPRDALQLLGRGVYEVERYQTELFEQEIRAKDIVLDLGAHIGYYTLLAARRVGDAGRVIAFEPNPTNFSYLERNVRLNGCENVVLYRKAVADRTGPGRLYLSADNSGDHRIFEMEEGRPSIEIEMVRLDEFLPELRGRIRLVKMDLQGAEGLALRGLRRLLEGDHRLSMITEFSPNSMFPTGVAPEEFLEEIRDLGMTIHRIDEEGRRLVFLERGWREFPEGEGYLNLLCCRAPSAMA